MKKPDWKNAADYAHITIEKIGAYGVAWEFLRRNVEYQKDFQNLADGSVVDGDGNPPILIETGLLVSGPKTGFFSPPLQKGQSQRAWLIKNPGRRILTPEKYLSKKWKIKALCDPQHSALIETPRFVVRKLPRIITLFDEFYDLDTEIGKSEDGELSGPLVLSPDIRVVVFSLNESITPQWKRIEQQLIDLQTVHAKKMTLGGTSSPKSTVWIPALRAWDSRSEKNAQSKSIRAKILYGDNSNGNLKKLSDHVTSAKNIIQEKYKEIARLGN